MQVRIVSVSFPLRCRRQYDRLRGQNVSSESTTQDMDVSDSRMVETMITADQLVAHAVGDYVLQSDWMANEKTKKSFAAACHALTYALPFLLLRPSIAAFALIVSTHFIIDRWRLARFVVYAKNFLCPRNEWVYEPGFTHQRPNWQRWADCSATGYHKDRPAWLSVWLLIIADNIMHVLINGIALKFL